MLAQSIRRSSEMVVTLSSVRSGSLVQLRLTKSGDLSLESCSKSPTSESEEGYKNSFSDLDGDPDLSPLRGHLESLSTASLARLYLRLGQRLDSASQLGIPTDIVSHKSKDGLTVYVPTVGSRLEQLLLEHRLIDSDTE